MFRTLLELCRISNLPTVWTNVTAAWIIACFGMKWRIELLWLLIGASLVYCAGMILNDACDAAWDRNNRPERPIPSGRISLRAAWALGIGGLLGGYALMVLAGGARPGITAALVGAIVLYDVYHKPWAGSVIVMGACRTLLYLAAGSAALPGDGESDAIWGVIAISGTLLGLYIIALSLIARAEAKGGIGAIKRLVLLALLILPFFWTLIIAVMAGKGPEEVHEPIWIPILFFLGWITYSLKVLKRGGPAIGQAVGLLLAGIPIVDALAIATPSFKTAVAFMLAAPLLRYWQRWVAAT